MQVKDYYGILEIPPAASSALVKKSFRRLAMLHHPDKHPGNPVEAARFREIREAYEVLNDPGKREQYNYQRWYRKSMHHNFSDTPGTAEALAAECRRLTRYLDHVNRFSVDYDALSYHLRQLLTDAGIALLREHSGPDLRTEVTHALIHAAELLPYDYIQPVTLRLNRLAEGRADLQQAVLNLMASKARDHRWNRYRTGLVICITLILCLIIYLLSN